MQQPEKAMFFLEKADDILKLKLKEVIKMQIIKKKPEIAAKMEIEVVGIKIHMARVKLKFQFKFKMLNSQGAVYIFKDISALVYTKMLSVKVSV